MFYVIYVLAIFRTVLSLKINVPGNGMVKANKAVEVSLSRQHAADPTSVLMLVENLIGGNLTPLTGTAMDVSATAPATFSDIGTFRLWAVNPSNSSESFAMSDNFDVLANNVAMHLPGGQNMNMAIGNQTSPDAPSSSASTSPRLQPAIIGAIVGGVVLLIIILLAVAYVLYTRRMAHVVRRMTFHRSRMVRSLPPLAFAAPRDAENDSPVQEKYAAGPEPRNVSGSRFMEDLPRPARDPYPFARTQ
ncbi:hypothetical protein B0H11DRAFT_2096119 [Mycena galericulata]|nr:hypothetical protein B0H11DRAFT_2096119 [Mycena galericulata]